MLKISDLKPQFPFEIRKETQNIQHIISKQNRFDFDIRLSSGVNLQRDFCWDSNQQNALLETILKSYSTIGSVVVIENFSSFAPEKQEFCKIEVIDGKHRLITIIDFFNGKIPFNYKGVDYQYEDLDEYLKNAFLSTNIDVFYVIEYLYFINNINKNLYNAITEENEKDYLIKDYDKIKMLEMFSYKGTPQAESHLENLYKLQNT